MWGSGRGSDHGRAIAAFLLWLVYGYGARLTQDERLEGAVSHEVSAGAITCGRGVAQYHYEGGVSEQAGEEEQVEGGCLACRGRESGTGTEFPASKSSLLRNSAESTMSIPMFVSTNTDTYTQIYSNAAISFLSTLTDQHSLATVQCLLLLETYSFWHPRSEISTWQVAGLALRTAVEIGLHRRLRSRAEREKDPLRYEMKKRVFWAVYTMDR